MLNFLQWLLLEQFDPLAYNKLFDDQLEALLPRLTDSGERSRLGRMLGFGWSEYIAASLRNAGFREQGQLEELIHDIVVKLLVWPGGLFKNYDERRHGPLDKRFKASVGNSVRNIVEKEQNRKKYLRPVPIGSEFVPGECERTTYPLVPKPTTTPRLSRGSGKSSETGLAGSPWAFLMPGSTGSRPRASSGSRNLVAPASSW